MGHGLRTASDSFISKRNTPKSFKRSSSQPRRPDRAGGELQTSQFGTEVGHETKKL